MNAKYRPSRLLWASLALFGIAIVLLVLPSFLEERPALPEEVAPLQPTPPWGTFPTRVPSPTATLAPTPTPAAYSPLGVMRAALQYDRPEVAEVAWEEARRVTPEDSPLRGHVMREGARLALLRGDLDTAEARAWDAVRVAAQEAETWALLGVILARQGESAVAEQAMRIAESLDPGLAPDVFADRWRAARQSRNGETMLMLAQTFSSREPENPLGFYYRAAALLASGEIEAAFRHILILLRSEPDSAAVFWYTLGETYLAKKAYQEALTVFAVAESRFAAGDQSLYLASDEPLYDLNVRRAEALLGLRSPQQCAKAESILLEWNAPAELIARARVCQTPTPTLTPWIPVQIGMATPRP